MESSMTPQSPSLVKRILFVCVQNSCRSQIAEAFARMYDDNTIEPYSAGSRPSGQVHPKAIAAMRALGYDMTQHRSKALSEIPNLEYDVAVTMGCGDECPAVRAKRRDAWDIADPTLLPPEQFRAVRDLIGTKVQELLKRL
jgi:arsenate reductase